MKCTCCLARCQALNFANVWTLTSTLMTLIFFCLDLHSRSAKKTADCLISNKLLNLDVTWCHNCNSESLCRAVARATSFAWDQLWTQLAMDAGVDQPGLWMRLSIYWKNGFVWEFGTSKSKRISSVSPLKWHFLEFTYIPFWPHAMCKQCSVGQLAQLAALFQVSFMPALQLPRP